MSDLNLITLGRIVAVFGIRGELKVHSQTEPPENILSYTPWWLVREGESLKLDRVRGKVRGRVITVQIPGVVDRTQALGYVGYDINIESQQLPGLQDGEYYWQDLIGLRVFNTANECFGVVDHLVETGANDVLVVKPCEGSLDGRERWLPYTEACVLEIDLVQRCLRVDWDADF